MKRLRKLVPILIFFMVLLCKENNIFAEVIPEGFYRFKNVNSGMYLDCEGTSNSSNVRQMYYPSWNLPQKFWAIETEEDYFILVPSHATTMSINVNNNSNQTGANINLYQQNDSDGQKWKFVSNEDGTFCITSKCSDDSLFMAVENQSTTSGANILQDNNTINNGKKWIIEAAVEEASYLIRNKITGKYLTVSGNYIIQADYADNTSQQFYINPSSNGYYDIAPIEDKDYMSLSVAGWDQDLDSEGAYVYVTAGQSASGQRWKFLVNSDGSYRIVSELSGCQKSLTINNSSDTYIYSYTYTESRNADWELIRVSSESTVSMGTYQKKGRNVYVDLDTKTYLEGNISPENLTRMIVHLDQAYDLYYELVGRKPANGDIIKIVEGDGESNSDATMWTYADTDKIYWNDTLISSGLRHDNTLQGSNAGWNFGLLHEMGHVFDYDDRWVFDAEFSANFKMAYIFYQLDGEFETIINGYEVESYSDLINYYYDKSSGAYTNSLGLTPMVYNNDGLTYMFLDQIGDDWDSVASTYRMFLRMSSTQIPSTKALKYNKFLEYIDTYATSSFLYNFISKYQAQSNHAISVDFIKPEIQQ